MDLRKVETEVFKRTDAERDNMLPKLKPLAALSTAARGHAEWLAKMRKLLTYKTPHKGKKGSDVSQRIPTKNCGPAENTCKFTTPPNGCTPGWTRIVPST